MKKIISILLFLVTVINASLIDKYINLDKCDQIIDKKIYYICYSYEYKSLLSGWTRLYGNMVYRKNIKERPYFYAEKSIPKPFRVYYKDYTRSGYDRGHTVIADADADYSWDTLKLTYSMVNITLQNPIVNRKLWSKCEAYGRKLASKFGYIDSVTLVKYKNKKYKDISIPEKYYRIYINEENNFEECYEYDNFPFPSWKTDMLKNHKIDCSKLKTGN